MGEFLPGALEAVGEASLDAGEGLPFVERAVAVTDAAIQKVYENIRPGMTEKQVAALIEATFAERGFGLSFPTIAVSGPNTTAIHGVPGDRVIRENDVVMIDLGARYEGPEGPWSSDVTRTFFVGKPTPRQQEIWNIVHEAQRRALALVKPGARVGDIDAAARRYIRGHGFDIPHAVGHGVGRRVHERPTISAGSSAVLEVGDIITIEPGIYSRRDGFGVRVEDTLVVTEDGYRKLSKAPYQRPVRGAGRAAVAPETIHAPPTFEVDGKKAVFVDIQTVDVRVQFDTVNGRTTVKAVVDFEQSEAGQPVIDLVPDITRARINGEELDPAAYRTIADPDKQSQMRMVDRELPPGTHRLEVEYPLSEGVRYNGDEVEFVQRSTDLTPRRFAEQYFPTNFEYDRYAAKVTIDIVGGTQHQVIGNGQVTKNADGTYTVEFPPHYNTASFWLHVMNPAKYEFAEGTYQSVSGKEIPIVVYAGSRREADAAVISAQRALASLEADFGPYPHPSYIVKVGGAGGMEYSGATETSLSALAHETNHMWHARAMMPANGNAGWIDEAIASWHDNGYPTTSQEPISPSKLSGFSPWRRVTPRAAYRHGARLMAYLDHVFRERGGLRPLLQKLHAEYVWQPITTEIFLAFLEKEGADLNVDFRDLFARQVYGQGLDDVGAAVAQEQKSWSPVGLQIKQAYAASLSS